jgi:hypothetical protein
MTIISYRNAQGFLQSSTLFYLTFTGTVNQYYKPRSKVLIARKKRGLHSQKQRQTDNITPDPLLLHMTTLCHVATPWNMKIFDKNRKAMSCWLVKWFYANRTFIPVFTRARHWPMSRARGIQAKISVLISIGSILILYYSVLIDFPSGVYCWRHVSCMRLTTHARHTPCLSHTLDFFMSVNKYRRFKKSVFIFLHPSVARTIILQSPVLQETNNR